MATIALVDDDDRIRSSIKKMIQYSGHTVVEFNDAAPLLESINGIQIDLVVTDLQMPTSGEVLVTTLRERGIKIPILIITGQVASSDVDYLMAIGVQLT